MIRTARIALLVAVAVGLAIRLVLAFGVAPARIGGDPKVYDETAASIAGGHGFHRYLRAGAPGPPTAAHPPGWPYLLGAAYALTGHGTALDQRPAWQPARAGRALAIAHARWRVGRVVNAVLGALAVGLIGLLASELFSPAVGVAAAAIAAAAPALAVLGVALLSEPLFIVLELAGLLAVARQRRSGGPAWAAAAGVLVGLATLTRANGAVLLAPLALGVWTVRPRWSGRALAPVAVLLCGFAVTVGPWTVRNARALHAPVPVATDLGNTLAGTYNSLSAANHYRWRGPRHLPAADRAASAVRGEAAQSWALTRAALRYIGAHPLSVVAASAWNTERMLELDAHSRAILAREVASPRLAAVSVAGFALLAALGLMGVCTRAARRAPAFLWAAPAALWLATAPFAVNFSRFRAPLDPFLVLLAACALGSLAGRIARVRHPASHRTV